jgi:hypothetical protein
MIEVFRTDAQILTKGDSYRSDTGVRPYAYTFLANQNNLTVRARPCARPANQTMKRTLARGLLFINIKEEKRVLLENIARRPWSPREA